MATEILRPNAVGSETSITYVFGETVHWEAVDEAAADGYTTYLAEDSLTYKRDLFNLPASSGSGTINFIKIYFRCIRGVEDFANAKPSLKSNSTVTDGTEVWLQTNWETHSQQWNTNPADAGAWEWADIDALQIGVSLKSTALSNPGCTQVYVEIDYTPPPPTDYPISLSPGLTASVSIDRDVAWDRGTSPGLTASATVDREVAWDRGMSPGLTLAVTIVKSWGRAIATSPGLVVSATVSRVLAYDRASAPGLTAAITIVRTVAWDRALQPALSVAVTVVRTIAAKLTTSPGLTVSASVDREVAWDRGTSPGLTASVTVDREVTWGRATQAALSVAVTIVRTVAWDRALQPGLAVAVAAIGRAVTYTRTIIPNLTVSIFIRFFVKAKRRIATLGTNRTIGTVGDNREVTTTGENRDLEDW